MDTSELPEDLTRVRTKAPGKKAGWWPAGAAITLSLARQLHTAGVKDLGVVTPYRRQADVTLGALRREFGPTFDCGTSHRFQGREFDNVIFDLVEPIGHNGWMTAASTAGSRWAVNGSKLFNVAVLTAKEALPDLGGSLGTPQQRPSAAEELTSSLTESFDTAAGELTFELGGHPDETQQRFLSADDVYATIPQLFNTAEKEIQIWSPFIASRRLTKLLPLLAKTVNAGVAVTVRTKPTKEIRDGQTNSEKLLIVEALLAARDLQPNQQDSQRNR